MVAFQALYLTNRSKPKAVAIIHPGHLPGGGNWTDYRNPEMIVARSVLRNPNGMPDMLLYGGYGELERYKSSCWPECREPVGFADKVLHHNVNNMTKGWIGIWTKSRVDELQGQ